MDTIKSTYRETLDWFNTNTVRSEYTEDVRQKRLEIGRLAAIGADVLSSKPDDDVKVAGYQFRTVGSAWNYASYMTYEFMAKVEGSDVRKVYDEVDYSRAHFDGYTKGYAAGVKAGKIEANAELDGAYAQVDARSKELDRQVEHAFAAGVQEGYSKGLREGSEASYATALTMQTARKVRVDQAANAIGQMIRENDVAPIKPEPDDIAFIDTIANDIITLDHDTFKLQRVIDLAKLGVRATGYRDLFVKLRNANIERHKEWAAPLPEGAAISLAFRGLELAGEAGEACNVVKKIERERMGLAGSLTDMRALADELADVVICADLIAMDTDIDLGFSVARKFNATSKKHGFKTMLTFDASPAVIERRLSQEDANAIRYVEAWADGHVMHGDLAQMVRHLIDLARRPT